MPMHACEASSDSCSMCDSRISAVRPEQFLDIRGTVVLFFFLRWDYTALLCILSYSLGCLVFGFFCSRFLDSGVLGVCQHA